MPLVLKSYFPYTVTVDGQPIHLRIKRLTVPEFEQFGAEFSARAHGRGAPSPAGPETETPETFRGRLDAEVAYLQANAAWLLQVFERYVTVEPGQLCTEGPAGESIEVTNGRQFADLCAGLPVIAEVLGHILLENSLSAEQKKTLQSRSASPTGSTDAPASTAAGAAPALTVASAESEVSAGPAAATEPCSDALCGTTAP